MNSKEHIKSIILGLLVLMSIVLTYMVWNFTPDLNNVASSENSKSNEPKPLSKPMTAKWMAPSHHSKSSTQRMINHKEQYQQAMH